MTTLRELDGLDQAPAQLVGSTPILIDYQNTYTQGAFLRGNHATLVAHGSACV